MPDYTITELKISNKNLKKLPDDIDKYNNLEILRCSDNKITSLDNLPPNLEKLVCCYTNRLKYDFVPTLENIRNYNAARMLSSNT